MKANLLLMAAHCCRVLLLGIPLCAACCNAAEHEWLRGTGDSLELRFSGEVLNDNGQPMTDFTIACQVRVTNNDLQTMDVKVDGSRFETWVPARMQPYFLLIHVASKDERFAAFEGISSQQFRQVAMNGLQIKLNKQRSRVVKVKAEYQGKAIPGAHVQAGFVDSSRTVAKANKDGIAELRMLADQELSQLTAWTDDFKMGGFGFSRRPTRDPAAAEFSVELSQCVDKKLRVVDETGAPVANFEFVLLMATLPTYNYIGTNENSRLTTDANGEVIYRWFPDWEERYCYITANSKTWLPEQDHAETEDGIVFRVTRSSERKRVSGKVCGVADLAGLQVGFRSFQGERENESDLLAAYTDADGSFTVDVLPDATYCVYVLDPEFVCQTTDMIAFDSSVKTTTLPEIEVFKGQKVEVAVTTGAAKQPYRNLQLSFRKEHSFTWREDGQIRNGRTGPTWWATTNEQGIATINLPPGKVEVSVFTPLWRAKEEVDVIAGGDTRLTLHRPFEDKQRLTGELFLNEGVQADLSDVQISICSVDGKFDDELALTADSKGAFSFETMSTEVAVFAYTKDGKAAGAAIFSDVSKPLRLELHRTMDYYGQILGDEDQPRAGETVVASVRMEGNEDYKGTFVKMFRPRRFTTQTDAEGKYVLRRLPANVKINVALTTKEDSEQSISLDTVYLEFAEDRPLAISRTGTSKPLSSKRTLEQRTVSTLRDCRVMGFRMMVITSSSDKPSKEFIDRYFTDYNENKEVSTFIQVVLSAADLQDAATDSAYGEKRGWELPDHGHVNAYAIDSAGNDLGKIQISLQDSNSPKLAAAFVHEHAPEKQDASQKWDKAFKLAQQTDRRVWARISQRYCGPCFLLARWLDDHKETLDKEFVMLKIDDYYDLNGVEISKRLTLGKPFGIPFHAIYSPDGTMIIDSAGPLGNIGHPSGYEGKKQLRKMFETSTKHLSIEEIDQLIESL